MSEYQGHAHGDHAEERCEHEVPYCRRCPLCEVVGTAAFADAWERQYGRENLDAITVANLDRMRGRNA